MLTTAFYKESFHLRKVFIWFGGHNAVQFGVFREPVHKRDDDVAVEKQALSGVGMGDVGKLMRGYAELLGEYLPVAARLVEHINEDAVFKFVLSRVNVQK